MKSEPLSNGWSQCRIGDLCKKVTDGEHLTPQFIESGMPLLSAKDVTSSGVSFSDMKFISQQDFERSLQRCKPEANDILMVSRGATIGRTILNRANRPFALMGSVILLKVNERLVSPAFLTYVLQDIHFQRHLLAISGSSAQQAIYLRDLKRRKVIVPPLPEQRKIAAILSTWDRAIELTEKLIAAKQRRKQALMQQLLRGKVRFAEFKGEPWKQVDVRQVLSVRKEQLRNDGTYPLYSLTIEDGVTPKSERYDREFLVRDKSSKKYKVVLPGDIVFNPSNLRWGAIGVHRGVSPVLVSPIYEVLYVTDQDGHDKSFIYQQLSSPRQIQLFAGMAEGTLIERTAVKLPTFLKSKIAVPPSTEEQFRIAAVLSAVDREIALLSERKTLLLRQKKGLMQQLLTGKVRVSKSL